LREYLLIAQHRPHLTQLIKQDDGSWIHREYNEPDAVVRLVSLDCELTLREIYDNFIIDDSGTTPRLRLIE
jgi:hypothetical protein